MRYTADFENCNKGPKKRLAGLRQVWWGPAILQPYNRSHVIHLPSSHNIFNQKLTTHFSFFILLLFRCSSCFISPILLWGDFSLEYNHAITHTTNAIAMPRGKEMELVFRLRTCRITGSFRFHLQPRICFSHSKRPRGSHPRGPSYHDIQLVTPILLFKSKFDNTKHYSLWMGYERPEWTFCSQFHSMVVSLFE